MRPSSWLFRINLKKMTRTLERQEDLFFQTTLAAMCGSSKGAMYVPTNASKRVGVDAEMMEKP